jgi:hypothetical protein
VFERVQLLTHAIELRSEFFITAFSWVTILKTEAVSALEQGLIWEPNSESIARILSGIGSHSEMLAGDQRISTARIGGADWRELAIPSKKYIIAESLIETVATILARAIEPLRRCY